MNIEEKIEGIIAELNFIKNNHQKAQSLTEFCLNFRLALISKLEQAGAVYDPTLELERLSTGNNTTKNKKFFAFKKSDNPSEYEILDSLERVHEILSTHMEEFGDLKNLSFNIQKIEGLRDRDAFSDLIRGILVVKETENING